MADILSDLINSSDKITEFITEETDDGWTIKKFNDHTFFAFFHYDGTISLTEQVNSMYYGQTGKVCELPSGLNETNLIAGIGYGANGGGILLQRVLKTDGGYGFQYHSMKSLTNQGVNATILVYGTW